MRGKQTTITPIQQKGGALLPRLIWGLSAGLLLLGAAGAAHIEAYSQVIREASIDRKFEHLGLRVRANGTISVIVQLAVADSSPLAAQQVQTNLLDVLVGYDPATVKRFSFLPILALRINLTGLESLRASPLVLDIEEDTRMSASRVRPYEGETGKIRPADGWDGTGQTIIQIVGKNGVGGPDRELQGQAPCPVGTPGCPGDRERAPGERSRARVGSGATILTLPVVANLEGRDLCSEQNLDGNGSDCHPVYRTDLYQALDRIGELRATHSVAAVHLTLPFSRPEGACDEKFSVLHAVLGHLRASGIAPIVEGESFEVPACLPSTIDAGRLGPVRFHPGEIAEAFAVARQKAPTASVEEILMALTAPPSIGRAPRLPAAGGELRLAPAVELLPPGPADRKEAAIVTIPTDVLATSVSTTEVQLRWTDNSFNELGFLIRRRVGIDGPWLILATVGPNVTSHRDLNLTPGQVYTYTVTAVTMAGEAPVSNETSVTMPIYSFVPLSTGQTTSGSIILGRSMYYRISVPEGALQLLAQTNGSGNVDLFMRHGTQPTRNTADCRSTNDTTAERCVFFAPAPGDWYIMVYGNARFTNNFTLHTNYVMSVRTDIPNAPSNLQAAALSNSQIELRWTDNATNELGFEVRRKAGPDAPWGPIATLGPDSTRFLDTGLDPNLSYFYTVVAFNSTGISVPSNEARATTPGSLFARPAAPSNLVAGTPTPAIINLQWIDNSPNEDGFRIRRRTGSSDLWAVIATVPANTTSFQDFRVFPETTYFYSVTAYNIAGESASSNEVGVTTLGEGGGGNLSAIPLNLQVTAISTTETDLLWVDNSFNELGFRIRRKNGFDGPWVLIGIVEANMTQFRDTGLVPGSEYIYQISSFNFMGDSPGSNETSVLMPINTFHLLQNGVQVNHTVGQNRTLFYRIHVPIGTTELLIQTKGVGSNGLFVRYGLQPTTVYFNCRSFSNTSNNRCLFPNPTPGDWHIMVTSTTQFGSNYNVTATYTTDPILSLSPRESISSPPE
jgi:fibronectin type 3 domain-containing protein